ncbi:MAG TPA: mercuric transporter MerT family protein [Gemmatimonadales bacterium]|nr:mercuric transporter MerT family protein [Gemmatimonadales bacterium]
MTTPVTKTVLAVTGGIAAAVGSALCCAGPLLAITLGLSGAGLAATFEPLRPYFVSGTVLALGLGFVVLHREERKACEPGTPCASPTARRRMKRALWAATLVAIPLVTFPWWSRFVLG